MSDLRCGNCGTVLPDESGLIDASERHPCLTCGSTARSISLQGFAHCQSSATVTVTVISYPEALLGEARALLDAGKFGFSVVAAHMACEVCVERALSRAFASRCVASLEVAVEDLLPGYNLANDRVRNLYNALTGDAIQKQSFWAAFKKSAERRNGIVHKGLIVNQTDAEASFTAASALVAYLKLGGVAPQQRNLIVVDGIFAICKQNSDAPLPGWASAGKFFSITRTPDELSIVCLQDGVPEGVQCERDWRCLRVAGTMPFSVVGILGSLTAPLSQIGVSVFAVSTFDTDYLLVKEADFEMALAALEQAGHSITR